MNKNNHCIANKNAVATGATTAYHYCIGVDSAFESGL